MAPSTSAPANRECAPPLDPEVFDDDQTIEHSGRLAELLRLWNQIVRGELETVQSFPVYDGEARRQQRGHQFLVVAAAIAGSVAVLFAIIRLPEVISAGAIGAAIDWVEVVLAAVALAAVVIGLSVAFHNRWHLLRMKAEQYRFLKFQMLLHAAGWMRKVEHERREELRTLLAGIHGLAGHHAHDWSQGVFTLVADDFEVIQSADAPLADDIVRYFRARRIRAQRDYFSSQSAKRHETERRTWLIPPACFFLSIVCALAHFAIHQGYHALHRVSGEEHPPVSVSAASPAVSHVSTGTAGSKATAPSEQNVMFQVLIYLTIGAAAFPVVGAGFRTMRTAFEFGRNANRFSGVARFLTDIEDKLDRAKSPAVKLELLREAEFVLRNENRSWMRLMIEAEWFG